MPSHESSPEREPKLDRTREIVHLAEQVSQGGLKALPGNRWALHYPGEGAVRAETLKGLLEGRYEPADVAVKLRPDAVIFNVADIEKIGLDGMTARIREVSAMAEHGDYERFASFVASMKGKDADIGTLQTLYDGITKSRTRSQLLKAYGKTGQQQMETALRHDADATVTNFQMNRGIDRVLQTLKMQWLERRGLATSKQTDTVLNALSAKEKELYEHLADAYASYADSGNQDAFAKLQDEIRSQLPAISDIENQMSPEMEELKEELEEFMDDAVPPGTPGDLNIPPDDEDEYHTSEPNPDESSEKGPSQAIFEITPAGANTDPLAGYFASGRKSYYDAQTKTWSKKKQLTPYETNVTGDRRWTISGRIGGGLKSLPIPAGYCLDNDSLSYSGEEPTLFRDQKGCFYVQSTGSCLFSVDFLKESPATSEAPISEDLAPLTQGPISADAETMLSSLQGSAVDRAQKIVRYVHNHHFYPGGGDLTMAQALQHKLRTQSTGDTYIQNLEMSEYLECYSSNTLFIAYCRKAGVPARLVVGHKTDGAQNGKTSITTSTGHAWSEFWDGQSWRRIDATPPVKPDDKKKGDDGQNEQNSTPSSNADDDGIDTAPEQQDITDQMRDKIDEKMNDVQNQQMSEADTDDVSSGESTLDEAKKKIDQMKQKQREMQKKINETKSFQDLEKTEQEIQESDLYDDMKEALEEMRTSKEEQMKTELEERIDAMADDGFMDEDQAAEMHEQMKEADAKELDAMQKIVERDEKEYQAYDSIREEVMPLVEHWYKYFAEHLPKESDIDVDDSSLTRRGLLNRKAMMKPSALLFGKVRNPRVFKPSVKPRFIASILVDVSGSMKDNGKLESARKLLVFYSELFSRISREFGYIRFSINTFSDSITKIKGFDQDYDSRERYEFAPGDTTTVKVRLMRSVKTDGGTNMLDALDHSLTELDEQREGYEDHVSALYFIGDGEDTCGNKYNIQKLLGSSKEKNMHDEHLKSAVLLGSEQERRALSELFGDEHTTVAGNFDQLIEQSMSRFADDIEQYCDEMTMK